MVNNTHLAHAPPCLAQAREIKILSNISQVLRVSILHHAKSNEKHEGDEKGQEGDGESGAGNAAQEGLVDF